MKLFWQLLSMIFILIVAAACAEDVDGETAVPNEPQGPALIMFYTDN